MVVLARGYARTLLVTSTKDLLNAEVTNPLAQFRVRFQVHVVHIVGVGEVLTLKPETVEVPSLHGISLFMVERTEKRKVLAALEQTLAPVN